MKKGARRGGELVAEGQQPGLVAGRCEGLMQTGRPRASVPTGNDSAGSPR